MKRNHTVKLGDPGGQGISPFLEMTRLKKSSRKAAIAILAVSYMMLFHLVETKWIHLQET
jgi:hypothetical protein